MRLVIIESPFAGNIDANIAYAREAVRDCLQRGEAPIASHLLFTQDGVLRDDIAGERRLGIEAGLAWYQRADAAVFYLDRGMSGGMEGALEHIRGLHTYLHAPGRTPIEYRFLMLGAGCDYSGARPVWDTVPFQTPRDATQAETASGLLRVARTARPQTPTATFEVTLAGAPVAFYSTMERGQMGGELYERWHRERDHARQAKAAAIAARDHQAPPPPLHGAARAAGGEE